MWKFSVLSGTLRAKNLSFWKRDAVSFHMTKQLLISKSVAASFFKMRKCPSSALYHTKIRTGMIWYAVRAELHITALAHGR